MSWLSSLFGGGGEDPEAVRQRQASAAAEAARQAQAASDRQMQMQLDYLNQLRADEAAKQAKIEAADPTATRNTALQAINAKYTPGFQNTLLPETYDDTIANAIYGEQRAKGDEYLNNLRTRGVITDVGYQKGQSALEEQAPRVRTQLQSIGKTLLDAERAKLGGIADTGRQAAGTLGVGQAFDINPYDTQVQSELGNFGANFLDQYKSGIPGDLFDTSGLAALAGGAGGGAGSGNVFDPAAVAGDTTDASDPFSGQKPIQKRTSTVF